MTRPLQFLSAVVLALSFGCATHHGRQAAVEAPLPPTTPYESDSPARSDYLAGYRAGYRDYLAGSVQMPCYEAGHYPVAERRGYSAGITAAMECMRQSVSQPAGALK